MMYRMNIVHPTPGLRSPGRLRTHTQNICKNELRIGGSPPAGRSPGAGIKLSIAAAGGIITLGWVIKTIKNVSAYP
jgi:hypothetical protein